MRLSNSKANTFRRCPLKYKFKYVHKLEPKVKGLPLKRGDWLHQMLMQHYDGEGWKGIHAKLSKDFNNLFEEEREEYGDLPGETARIMRSYLRRWKREDQDYHVIDSEVDEILTLPNGDEFNFIIDLIVEDDMGLWLWDHKTVKSFMDPDFMLIDSQLARYFWGAEKMGYTPLQGVMFNEIRTKPPHIPEVLKSGRLSERSNMDTDLYTYLAAIKRLGQDPSTYRETLARLRDNTTRFFRRTQLPKDKPLTKRQMHELIMTADEIREAERLERFPRTVRKDCSWDCEFSDMCIVDLFGGDIQPMIEKNFQTRGRRDQ